MIAKQVLFSGRVQGVGFRYTTKQIASGFDLCGWVKNLPDGVQTVVGEGGEQLSAAQAQQLALARLVLADPAVAILDEATAEAGSLGARELEQAAATATEGRTTLLVAHRLTQALLADRVIVLDQGRIVEQGEPGELIKSGGWFTALWRAWDGRGTSAGPGASDGSGPVFAGNDHPGPEQSGPTPEVRGYADVQR